MYEFKKKCCFFVGHYLYLEASAPRTQGDKCWLVGPRFPATKTTCFQFWYSMSGRGIGSLNVIVKYPDAGTNNTVWSLSGDQGDKWLQGQVPIIASTTYQVCFLGGEIELYFSPWHKYRQEKSHFFLSII